MEHGKRSGQGKYTWGAQGAVYEGEYVDNRRQGLGTMAFPDKSRYEGGWDMNMQCPTCRLGGGRRAALGHNEVHHARKVRACLHAKLALLAPGTAVNRACGPPTAAGRLRMCKHRAHTSPAACSRVAAVGLVGARSDMADPLRRNSLRSCIKRQQPSTAAVAASQKHLTNGAMAWQHLKTRQFGAACSPITHAVTVLRHVTNDMQCLQAALLQTSWRVTE